MWTSDEANRERLDDLTAQMIDVQTELRETRARLHDLEAQPRPQPYVPSRLERAVWVLMVLWMVLTAGVLLGAWGPR